jgi:hypothetical protein
MLHQLPRLYTVEQRFRKGAEGAVVAYFKITSQHLLRGTKRKPKTAVRIAGTRTEI